MKPVKYIVDTTLRDGEQSPGYAMTKEQKIFIASLLDDANVFQIEAGIPAIGDYEKNTIREIIANKKNSKISVWNRLNLSDIKHSLECDPDIIHISVPVSYVQIYTKLHKNKAWIIKNIIACVDYAKSNNCEVTIGFEDASRADTTFMVSLAIMLKEMGVERIRFADTVGILPPSRTYKTIKELIDYTQIDVEIHAHNDLGMAIANSVEATKAGAKYIDTTIFGIGERVGNCNFQEFIYVSEPLFDFGISRLTAMNIEDKTYSLLVKS